MRQGFRTWVLWACVWGSLTACEDDPKPASPADATTADSAIADAGSDTTSDTPSNPDAAADTSADTSTDSSDAKADVAPTCESWAGGWVVTGTCSNGGSSIPYACMKAKTTGGACQLTWETDFRGWTGPLTGKTYALSDPTGSETITGEFATANTGSYQYKGGSLTCDATMERLSPAFGYSVCCDVVAQDCPAAQTCLPVVEATDGGDVTTTACLDLAANPTQEGAACAQTSDVSPCAKGSGCFGVVGGKPGGEMRCKRLCVAATDCSGGQQCVIASGAPKAGVCEVLCAPIGTVAGASACPSGQACTVATVSSDKAERVLGSLCIAAGSGKAGDKCAASSECGAGHACVQGQCRILCADANPCSAGSCKGFGIPLSAAMPKGLGYCQ